MTVKTLALLLAAMLGCAACSGSEPRASVRSSTTTSTTSTTLATSTTTTTNLSAPSTGATTSTVAGGCGTSQLSLAVGRPNAHAGGYDVELVLRNRSSSPCTVEGFPGVSFLDGQGRQLGPAVPRMTTETVGPVALAPGAAAYADLGLPDTGVVNCTAAQASQVRVYPPDQTHSLVAAFSAQVCVSTPPDDGIGPMTPTARFGT